MTCFLVPIVVPMVLSVALFLAMFSSPTFSKGRIGSKLVVTVGSDCARGSRRSCSRSFEEVLGAGFLGRPWSLKFGGAFSL